MASQTIGHRRWLARMLLLLPPLLLAGLELTHPAHVSHDVTGNFFPVANWWMWLHIIQFVLFSMIKCNL